MEAENYRKLEVAMKTRFIWQKLAERTARFRVEMDEMEEENGGSRRSSEKLAN